MNIDDILTSNYDRRAPIDLYTVCKKLRISIKYEHPISDDYFGMLDIEHNTIWVDYKYSKFRSRFILAHLLYCYMELQNNYEKPLVGTLVGITVMKYPFHVHKNITLQDRANQFAANLLMPEKELRYQYELIGNSATKLAKLFQVEALVMRLRLNQFGLHSI